MPKVTFLNELVTVEAKPGQTLLEIAEKNKINIFRGIWQDLHCSSNQGWCNRCKVWATPLAEGALSPRTSKENRKFRLGGALPKNGTMRLACQAVVTGDCEVRTRPGFVQSQSLDWPADPRHWKWQDRWTHRNDEPDEDEKPKAKKAAAPAAATAPAAPAAVAAPAAAAPAAAAPAATAEAAAPAPATAPAGDDGGGDAA